MNIDINETKSELNATLENFRDDWRNGELQTFSDTAKYLGAPLDDEELEKFIQCVHEILMQRAEKLEAAIEICKRYRLINPKSKEENEQ